MDPDHVLKANRLYLTITQKNDSPVEIDQQVLSRISISVLGEETGISEVQDNQHSAKAIYNLHGTRVKTPMKGGVYIVNGKKVVK
jgi:hypothetical protein